jgi:glycerophosphoryl diester phosphodiesterase
METDVHVTSDGVVVIMHDDTLDRTTDRAGTIARLPWNVVKEVRVGGTEPVPRLDEVLEACPTPASTSSRRPTPRWSRSST